MNYLMIIISVLFFCAIVHAQNSMNETENCLEICKNETIKHSIMKRDRFSDAYDGLLKLIKEIVDAISDIIKYTPEAAEDFLKEFINNALKSLQEKISPQDRK
ncbi:uncharacterized protein LOC128667576 [Microplitis demolitor]|uniref:uncharacterized protein LOC128667576 n=1 Tax=Microplitis demolitor TaxID=69319 RepID=UPI00044000D3|nr:uncharacterized protein LOC128667576 [Microplitis demolitor]